MFDPAPLLRSFRHANAAGRTNDFEDAARILASAYQQAGCHQGGPTDSLATVDGYILALIEREAELSKNPGRLVQ